MIGRLVRVAFTLLVVAVGTVLILGRLIGAFGSCLAFLATGRNPVAPLKTLAGSVSRTDARGMHRWYDLVDWVGGWPFEVARPEEVFRFLRDQGFQLEELRTCGGKLGCNEFLFRRSEVGGRTSEGSRGYDAPA